MWTGPFESPPRRPAGQVCRRWAAVWIVAIVGVGLLSASRAGAESASPDDRSDRNSRATDCRYRQDSEPSASPFEHVFLTHGSLFRPLLADETQPRFAASLRHMSVEPGVLADQQSGGKFLVGGGRFGSVFGIYGYRDESCNGLQIGISGSVSSQFNLNTPSMNLINSDFFVGLPISLAMGDWSARLRVYHQSSHLGDEFLLSNPDIDRMDLGFEVLDLLVTYRGSWWRVYGGGGYVFFRNPGFAPWRLEVGTEFRSAFWRPALTARTEMLAVAGADFESFETRNWGGAISAKGGLEFATDGQGARRLRVLVSYRNGFVSFGQFFDDENGTSLGGELQFEF